MDWLKRNFVLMLIILHIPMIIALEFMTRHNFQKWSGLIVYLIYFIGIGIGMLLYKFLVGKGVIK